MYTSILNKTKLVLCSLVKNIKCDLKEIWAIVNAMSDPRGQKNSQVINNIKNAVENGLFFSTKQVGSLSYKTSSWISPRPSRVWKMFFTLLIDVLDHLDFFRSPTFVNLLLQVF